MENKNPWFVEGSSKARLVSVMPNSEDLIAYVARVTSKDQNNPKIKGLLKYCAKHNHHSVFEQSEMIVEIVTPLAISVQALRHRSFKFQQFSGRYENQALMEEHTGDLPTFNGMFYMPERARLQDTKNRQNSIVSEDDSLTHYMWQEMEVAYKACNQSYQNLIDAGIAKELARFVLPEGVYTRLYMKGDARSFIHYIKARDDEGVAQYEHCELARSIKTIFSNQFPTLYQAFFVDEEVDPRDSEISELKVMVERLENEVSLLKHQKLELESQNLFQKLLRKFTCQ